jgi:hypothetical protein
MHNELHDLHFSSDIIRIINPMKMRRTGHTLCVGKNRHAYSILLGKLEGQRPLGIPKPEGEDNIKIFLKK